MAELGSLTAEEWAFWDAWVRAQRLLNREFDRELRRELALSKAEFGVLVTLEAAPERRMRVGELAGVLDWEKGRVAHQLTRMESRGLLTRNEEGAAGRRTSVELTAPGRDAARRAIRLHSDNIRRLVLDRLTPAERTAMSSLSSRLIGDLGDA
jgi:DNA-binding MarR family transcriptional regulator